MKRIFVGNLPPDVRTRDLEDLFYKFGKIAFIDLKTRRGPPFAFVEFFRTIVMPKRRLGVVMEKNGTVAGFALSFRAAENVFQDLKMAPARAAGPVGHHNGARNFVSKSPVFHRREAGKI